MMANFVSRDIRTTTGSNLKLLEEASGLCAWETGQAKLRQAVKERAMVVVVPFLGQRQELSYIYIYLT